MKKTSIRIALASALISILTAELQAQQDRVSRPIDNSRTAILKGPIHRIPQVEDDQGLVDPSMEIAYATLYLKPSDAQQTALEKLLVDQQNPATPNYRRWLTPEQYADNFGLNRGDIAKIVAWLESQGLTVNDVARGRHWITFTASAGNVGSAFHTEFHRYVTNGETHFANATDPSIPEALADVVAGVGGLDDYDLTPAYGKSSQSVNPDITGSTGAHYLSPDDIATIYDLTPLFNNGFYGDGQKIAVVGNSDLNQTDIQNFRTHFHLPQNPPQPMLVGPDPNSTANLGETDIDLEWSGAVAQRDSDLRLRQKCEHGGSVRRRSGRGPSDHHELRRMRTSLDAVVPGSCAAGQRGRDYMGGEHGRRGGGRLRAPGGTAAGFQRAGHSNSRQCSGNHRRGWDRIRRCQWHVLEQHQRPQFRVGSWLYSRNGLERFAGIWVSGELDRRSQHLLFETVLANRPRRSQRQCARRARHRFQRFLGP